MEDNEENALVAIRIIFDLHKTFKPALESQVQVYNEIDHACFTLSCSYLSIHVYSLSLILC